MNLHVLQESQNYLEKSIDKASSIMAIDQKTFYGSGVKKPGLLNGDYRLIKRNIVQNNSRTPSPKRKKNILDGINSNNSNIVMPALTKYSANKGAFKGSENVNKKELRAIPTMSPDTCRRQLEMLDKLKKSDTLKPKSFSKKLGIKAKLGLHTRPAISRSVMQKKPPYSADHSMTHFSNVKSASGKENVVRNNAKYLSQDDITNYLEKSESPINNRDIDDSPRKRGVSVSTDNSELTNSALQDCVKPIVRRLQLDGISTEISPELDRSTHFFCDVRTVSDNEGDDPNKSFSSEKSPEEESDPLGIENIIDRIGDPEDDKIPPRRSFGRVIQSNDCDEEKNKTTNGTVRPYINTRRRMQLEEQEENNSHKKPHEIGFPNPIGSNRCWMNATLQAILCMDPLIRELNSQKLFTKSRMTSNILEAFLTVVRSRQNGKTGEVHSSLGTLSKCLGLWDHIFASGNQQDAPEFLVRLLDCFREEFILTSRVESKIKSLENVSLNNLDSNDDETAHNDDDKENLKNLPNPVSDNVEFQLQETYTCTSCKATTTHLQDHLALFVDIPHCDDIDFPSMQDAVQQYMTTHTREMKCSKCESMCCEVTTRVKKLPRFFIIQVKRYAMEDSKVEKVLHPLRVPTFLSYQNYVTHDVTKPKVLKSIPAVSTENKNSESVAEDLSLENARKPEVITVDEETDIQEALRQSIMEDQQQEELEERHLEEAIKLSLQEKSYCSTPKKNSETTLSQAFTPLTTQNPEFGYRLIATITHHGDSLNSGHYVADIYNFQERKWYHYDDKSVTEHTEDLTLSHDMQHHGYVFFYIHRPLYEQLCLET